MSAAPPGSAKDQVVRLLRLVPYLYARGTVRVDEAAADLGVTPERLVTDLKVLFMCGLPGGYPDDLIDVDLDALEGEEADGVIRVSNADYLARPLQLSPTEATAVIVALRALRNGAADDDPRDRRPHPRQARGGGARGGSTRWSTRAPAPGVDVLGARFRPTSKRPPSSPPGAADLLGAVPRRGVRAGGRPARHRHRPRLHLPRRLVPHRRGAPAVPAGPDPGRGGARLPDPDPGRAAPRPRRGDLPALRRHHAGHAAAGPAGPLGGGVLPRRGRAPSRRRRPRGRPR